MKNTLISIKSFILDTLFPRCCINCNKEGNYLCEDCQSLIEVLENLYCPVCGKRIPNLNHIISGTCRKCQNKTKLNGLYFATVYQNPIVKKIISQFKYEPLLKELSKPLADLIITHFHLLNQRPQNFANFVLIPIPLHKKKLRWRGFNQAEEIGKELSRFFKIPLVNNVLVKIKETLPQVELSGKERKENLKGAFLVKNNEKLKNKKILLVDDVYTTGSTMEECARTLKAAGVKQVWGVVAAREQLDYR